jgi:hypothetical protein
MKITDAIACPWCGEKDRDMLMIIQTGYPTRPRKNVWCSMCNVTGPEGINEKSAIEQWNARAGGQQPVASKTAGTKHVGISDLFGDMLKTAMMSPHQEKIVNLGTCPSCMKPLECLGATGGYKWHQCKQCLAVWIMSPNIKADLR